MNKALQCMALWCCELIILLPLTMAAFQASYSGSPADPVSYRTATISWMTNQNATGRVIYGTSPGALSQSAEESASRQAHTVLISDLRNNTQYFYEMISKNSEGATIVSKRSDGSPFSFITERTPDLVPPLFTVNVTLSLPDDKTANLRWNSDEGSNSFLYYGKDSSLGALASDPDYATSHSITISVDNQSAYFYKVGMCDKSWNCVNSSVRQFMAGRDLTPPSINASVPEYTNARFITITGKTKPLTDLNIYVNDKLSRWTRSNANGAFKLANVELQKGPNTLRIDAKDQLGNAASQQYQTTVETEPPIASISAIPATASSQTLPVRGTVNKLCTVTFSVSSVKDIVAPPQVVGVNATVGTNSVRLSWNRNPEDDLLGYAVYRDNVRLTTTRENLFIDTGSSVDSGRQYTYRVSAFDQSCNEGIPSDPLAVTTLRGGQRYNQTPPGANLSCNKYFFTKSISVSGDFSESITLQQGINNVRISFTDRAGNSLTFQNTTLLDTAAPRFIETNLAKLNPAYTSEVTVTGKVSEPCTIKVYVNNITSPDTTTTTDADGNFRADVHLRKEFSVNYFNRQQPADQTGASYQYGDAWGNQVRVVAVDDVGLTAEASSNIILAQCGFGSSWNVKLSQPTPDMLTPRLILDGMAMIGVGVNISWQGGWDNGTISKVNLLFQPVNLEDEGKYDKGWVQAGYMRSRDLKKGYVTLNVKPQYPVTLVNQTMFQREENVSLHRVGECGVPGFGCVKVPMMLVIDYQTPSYNYSQQQRQCFDVMVAIDKRVPPNVIPEGFLKASITVLNATIAGINIVLEPLRKVKEYVFYACAASWGVDFLDWYKEAWACQFSGGLMNALKSAGTGTKFDKKLAETGQCDAYKDDNLQEQCKTCSAAIQTRKDFEQNYMRQLCDRIFCPSVPTLQKYIRDEAQKNPVLPIPGYKDFNSGSDCAAVFKNANPNPSDIQYKTYKDFKLDTTRARMLYDDYQQQKSGEPASYLTSKIDPTTGGPLKQSVDCNKPHVPNPNCCGTQYMNEWDSACLAMNELKENVCWHAEQENQLDALSQPTTTEEEPISCNVLWNKAAGICSPEGTVQPDLYRSNVAYSNIIDTQTEVDKSSGVITNPCLSEALVKGDVPVIAYRILPPSKDDLRYKVTRGAIRTRQTVTTAVQPGSDISILGQDTVFQPGAMDSDVTAYFFIPGVDPATSPKLKTVNSDTDCTNNEGCKLFREDMQKCTDQKRVSAYAYLAYNEIQKRIGIKEKDYIVEPPSGFLRSVQCACVPAIVTYLATYKAMLQAVQNCFQTILLTGDGSAGTCRAVLSVYVCDLIYDIIHCAMEKWGGSYQRSDQLGLGSFIGSLTSAGEGVSRDVRSRYGSTAIWQSMFAERKLVHSVCLFAFTGTWDIDINALIGQDYAMPINSTAMLYPCERRFVAFNPTSNPSGVTTWNYHFGVGMVAGSDLNNIRLTLKCSTGVYCDPQEGFVNGQCDCPAGEKRDITIDSLPSTLKAGGMILDQGDVYKNVQSNVRYDTAVLDWSYIDPVQRNTRNGHMECKIKQVGGAPPAFCSFDAGSGAFRCSVDMGSEMWAKFDPLQMPLPAYAIGSDAFTVGNQMQFNVNIQQVIPSNMQCAADNCQYTKYLKITVVNQNGRVIYAMDPQDYARLNTNARFSETVQLRAITAADFAGASGVVPKVSQVADTKANVPSQDGQLTGSDVYEANLPFFVEFQVIAGQNNYRICRKTVNCQNADPWVPYLNYPNVLYNGIRMQFPKDAVGKYQVDYTPTNSGNYCGAGADKVQWTATMEILDATQAGGNWVPGNQDTIVDGKPQKVPVPFQVQCNSVAGGQPAGSCPNDPTKKLSVPCYCANTPGKNVQMDCGTAQPATQGFYCVNKMCVATPGCDQTGKTALTATCICDSESYKDGVGGMCTSGSYCKASACLSAKCADCKNIGVPAECEACKGMCAFDENAGCQSAS